MFSLIRTLSVSAVCSLAVASTALGDGARVSATGEGGWWYRVHVPRFCNGNEQNDPPNAVHWSSQWEDRGADTDAYLFFREADDRRYGGDLQGLQSRLPYLSRLGVTTLLLSPVFSASGDIGYMVVDMRHIKDTLGVAQSAKDLTGETHNPSTWSFSASDRVFLGFLREAHSHGIRVFVETLFTGVAKESWIGDHVLYNQKASFAAEWIDVTQWEPRFGWRSDKGSGGRVVRFRRHLDGLDPGAESYLFAIVQRWMDPNADGDPSDGVDGWIMFDAATAPTGFVRRLGNHMR